MFRVYFGRVALGFMCYSSGVGMMRGSLLHFHPSIFHPPYPFHVPSFFHSYFPFITHFHHQINHCSIHVAIHLHFYCSNSFSISWFHHLPIHLHFHLIHHIFIHHLHYHSFIATNLASCPLIHFIIIIIHQNYHRKNQSTTPYQPKTIGRD